VKPIILALALIVALMALFAALHYIPARAADQPFNWDRYHSRQDACLEQDRIAADCARGYCDELALRQAQRTCSPFSGSRERDGGRP
jgi:hypothetical protein